MKQRPSQLRKTLQWIAFLFMWSSFISICCTTFLAFEIFLGIRGGGFIGNRNLPVFNQRIPVKDLLSPVFAGLIEVGSLVATAILFNRRKEGQSEDEQHVVTLQKKVAKHTKALLTFAQTFILSVVLSTTISTGGQNSGIQEFNPNPSQPPSTQSGLPEDPLVLVLIIFLSPTGAIVMTWLIPEWTLKITRILTDTDESES